GIEEEVAREVKPRDLPVLDVEVDDDELSTGDLVLTVHESSLRRAPRPRHRPSIWRKRRLSAPRPRTLRRMDGSTSGEPVADTRTSRAHPRLQSFLCRRPD